MLTSISEIMHKDDEIPIACSGSLLKEAIIEMTQKSLGCLAIVDSHTSQIIGIITDGDLRRHMSDDLLNKKVEEIMTKKPICINSEVLISDALHTMETQKITCLFVINQKNIPIGCVHMHDILRTKIVSCI
jgi:arabinose-5-phosphate isomerase